VHSRVAHLSTRSVRYLEAGSGRPLVWLHAFPLSADQWLPQLSRVPPGWRFIAPDLRGFRGGSVAYDAIDLAGVTMDGYAADALDLMTQLEIADATIGGLSMGGYVAFALLRRAPTRVNGLVLADTRATADTPEGRAARDRMTDLVKRDGPSGIAREMLPKLLGPTSRRDQPDLEDAVRRLIEVNTTAAIAAALEALKTRPDATPLLASITCPTLIICGEEDALTPMADSEAMHQAIPGSRLVRLAGAGHLSNLENPLGFNAALASLPQ
jgi:3-oxoadipate enol-lactonase